MGSFEGVPPELPARLKLLSINSDDSRELYDAKIGHETGNKWQYCGIRPRSSQVVKTSCGPESRAGEMQELVDGQRATLPRSICRMSAPGEIGAG
jgi:hypothetical protein